MQHNRIPSRKSIITVVISLMLLFVMLSPASAINYGVLDGNDHPYVGLAVFDDANGPAWRCSGTLLSPTVFLTAGHCTSGAVTARVWFEADVESGIPANGYPFGGGTSVEAASIHSHPQYIDGAFYMYDVGIVVLRTPVTVSKYGKLAPLGTLDGLSTKRGHQNQLFTPVGYGLQSVVPSLQADRVRYKAEIMLVDTHGTAGIPPGTSVMFSNSPGQHATGGTCFGDSGGPIFMGTNADNSNVVVAVTSFGLNANCAGSGGGYRVDTVDDQNFINSFLP